MARERLTALRYPSDDVEAITRLVFLHLRFHGYGEGDGGWTDSAVRRYVRDAGDLLDDLNELTRCDCTTRNERRAKALEQRMDALVTRIDRLAEQEELKSIRPELDGNTVMELLGLSPGPEVGDAMRYLLDIRLDEGLLGEAEIARRLRDWWSARS
jgi:poly(A) polymerase